MRSDFSYSNTLGWNTFPVPLLTEQNKANLITPPHFPQNCYDYLTSKFEVSTLNPLTIKDKHERSNMGQLVRPQ